MSQMDEIDPTSKEVVTRIVPENIRERVQIAMGQASMCWSDPFTRDCVFDTEEATQVGDQLCQFIMDEIDKAGGCP